MTITMQAINNLQANLWTAVMGKDKARNADSIDQKYNKLNNGLWEKMPVIKVLHVNYSY